MAVELDEPERCLSVNMMATQPVDPSAQPKPSAARNWQVVPGVVVSGYGVASGRGPSPYPAGTIAMQAPFFAERGLDLSPYHLATINVRIHPLAYFMVAPFATFRGVRWTPAHGPEDFSFSPCRIRVTGDWSDGLVYYPHPETKPAHRQDPSTLEILAPFLPEVAPGVAVDVAVDLWEVSVS